MFFNAYAFKGQMHVCCRTNENCKRLVLQDKCNIEVFLSPVVYTVGNDHANLLNSISDEISPKMKILKIVISYLAAL